jgi:hypothetical protein
VPPPNWALKRFDVFLGFLDGSSSNRECNVESRILLPPMFLVQVRVLWLNLEIWKVKDWI